MTEKDNQMNFTPEDEGNFKHTVNPLDHTGHLAFKLYEVLGQSSDSQRGF